MLPLDFFLLLGLLIAQFVDLNFGLLDGALRGERLLLLYLRNTALLERALAAFINGGGLLV